MLGGDGQDIGEEVIDVLKGVVTYLYLRRIRFGAFFARFEAAAEHAAKLPPLPLTFKTEHAQFIRLSYTTDLWRRFNQKCLKTKPEEIFRQFRATTTSWMGANAICHGDHCS